MIYSEIGMKRLAESAGMHVDRIVYDFNDYQFWASEGISAGKLSTECKPPNSGERRMLLRKAKDLNAQSLGDQAQFFLSKQQRWRPINRSRNIDGAAWARCSR